MTTTIQQIELIFICAQVVTSLGLGAVYTMDIG